MIIAHICDNSSHRYQVGTNLGIVPSAKTKRSDIIAIQTKSTFITLEFTLDAAYGLELFSCACVYMYLARKFLYRQIFS